MRNKRRYKIPDRYWKGRATWKAKTGEVLRSIPKTVAIDLLELMVTYRYVEMLLQNAPVRHYLGKYRPITLGKLDRLMAEFKSRYRVRRRGKRDANPSKDKS